MRLTDIEARELLSFDRLQLSDLPQTLVVVGPNGGGKTNLLRLLQIVVVAIDRAATFSQDAYWALMRFAASRRLGAAPADISSVRLGITLTEPWERELLASFVRAAIASSILRDTPTNGDASGTIAWARQHVTQTALTPVTSGAIVVDFVEAATGPWAIGYEFDVGGDRFRWVLDGMQSRGALTRNWVPARGARQQTLAGEVGEGLGWRQVVGFGRRSGGLRGGDGDGASRVELLQLPQQVGLALFG